jgi:hypothetical protein
MTLHLNIAQDWHTESPGFDSPRQHISFFSLILLYPRNEVRGGGVLYWNTSVCLSVDTNLYLLLLLGLCMDFDETLHTCYTYDLVSPGTPLCSAIFSRVMALDISKWKIVLVHYSLALKWLVFCILNMYFRIL